MKKIVVFLYGKETVAGDDGNTTLREVGAAWGLSITLFLLIISPIKTVPIETLFSSISFTITMIGISAGKSGFDSFVKSKYENKKGSSVSDNSYVGG